MLSSVSLPVFFATVLLIWNPACVAASDGFDNNYVSANANVLSVTIDGTPHAILFGPGSMSTGSFFINVPNNTTYALGQTTAFSITGISSFLRSAYFDRVDSTILFYRIYPDNGNPPPDWIKRNLTQQSALLPQYCYTSTQSNTWHDNQPIDILNGLGNGGYILEFYTRSYLYDVGNEDDPCNIDANAQCEPMPTLHPGRYISSRFNTTDPTACDLATILATQAVPSKVTFQVTNAPMPIELSGFHAHLRGTAIHVEWQTASTRAVSFFEVQHSSTGVQWHSLATIPPDDDDDEAVHRYDLSDLHPFSGYNYYRLKVRDRDDQEAIWPAVAVYFKENADFLHLWPNPASQFLFCKIPDAALPFSFLEIFDVKGHSHGKYPIEAGEIKTLSVESLPAGMYYVRIWPSPSASNFSDLHKRESSDAPAPTTTPLFYKK